MQQEDDNSCCILLMTVTCAGSVQVNEDETLTCVWYFSLLGGILGRIDWTNAVKRYDNVTVIPDLSVTIRNGELFTLLGPSGCGKTTLLRMIAGFNTIEGGSFKFNNRLINDMEPGKRGIGMVFQNYAIFPNMTVRKNVEFGLKYKDMPKEQMRKQAQKFLELVHVDQYADRMPERLSGGQQQRVALAERL